MTDSPLPVFDPALAGTPVTVPSAPGGVSVDPLFLHPEIPIPPLNIRLKAHWLRLARSAVYPIYAHLSSARRCRDPIWFEKAVKRWLKVWHMEVADQLGLLREYPIEEFGRFVNARPGGKFRGPGINAYKRGAGCATYFIAIERSPSGLVHAHALIKPSELLPLDLARGKRLWQGGRSEGGMAMGDAKVEITRNQFRATRYTIKNDLEGEVSFLWSPDLKWPT